jgi:hypothetical protein
LHKFTVIPGRAKREPGIHTNGIEYVAGFPTAARKSAVADLRLNKSKSGAPDFGAASE